MLASTVPVEVFRSMERGIIAKLVSIARGTVHTRTVNLSAGESLVVWSSVEYKRVAVTVDVAPAAAGSIAFTKSGAIQVFAYFCGV